MASRKPPGGMAWRSGGRSSWKVICTLVTPGMRLIFSINAGGGQAVAYPTDLTDESAVSELTKQIAEDHGRVDIVVSNGFGKQCAKFAGTWSVNAAQPDRRNAVDS